MDAISPPPAALATNTDTPDRPLPAGWRWVRLGEVCEINPPRPSLERADDTPTTFVQMSAVDESGRGISGAEIRPYREIRSGYTYFGEEDILFAKITPCMQNGKHAIARNLTDGIGFGSTEFHVVRPVEGVSPEWVHFFLTQPRVLQDATAHFAGAVGQQRVPKSYLADLHLPLPPLAEQRRIAALLRERMAAVESARAAAEAQQAAARALPAAELRTVFESDEAREWPMVLLGQVCIIPGQYGTSEKASRDDTGIPVLRMGNLRAGQLDWSDLKYLSLPEGEVAKYRLTRGDMLFNRTNSAELVGKTAVFDDGREAVFASYLIRFRFTPEAAHPSFVSAYINSEPGRRFINAHMARAIGQVNISASTMQQMPLPLPPLAVQQRIAAALEERMAQADTLRASLAAQLGAIHALPAALLRQAFNGEL